MLVAASGCSLILGISDLPAATSASEAGAGDGANADDQSSGSDAFTQGDGRVAVCNVPGSCDNAGGLPDITTAQGDAINDAGDYFTVRYCDPEAGACSFQLDLGSATTSVDSTSDGIANVKTVVPVVVERVSFVYSYISQAGGRTQLFPGHMQTGPCGAPPSTSPLTMTFHASLVTDATSVTAGCSSAKTLEIPDAGLTVKIDPADGGVPFVSQLSICLDADASGDAVGYSIDMATSTARTPLENALLSSLESSYKDAVDSQTCLAP